MSACITFRYPVGYHKLLQRSTLTEVIQNSWREIVARIRPRAICSVCRKQSEIAMVYLTSLCDWSRKLAPLSQPIKLKTETKRSLVTRVFPRFRQFAWFFSLSSHWLLMTFSPLWLAVVITLFLVQQHPIESCEVSCRYLLLFVPDWSLISDWDRFKQKCHIVNLSQAIFSFLYRNGQRGQTSLSWKRCRWSTATYF